MFLDYIKPCKNQKTRTFFTFLSSLTLTEGIQRQGVWAYGSANDRYDFKINNDMDIMNSCQPGEFIMREIFDLLFTLKRLMTNTFPDENKCSS